MCFMSKTTGGSSNSGTKGDHAQADPYASLFHGKSHNVPKLADVPAPTVAAAIDRILANGDAVMFSLTSDGGAVSLQLWSATGRRKLYCAQQAELDQTLTALELL